MPRLSQRQTLLNPRWVEKLLSHDTSDTANHLEDQRDFRLSSRIPHTRRELVDSPGAGTQVCRKLLPPLPSSPCCVSAGPACRTPTRRTKWGEALITLTNFSSWNVKDQHRKMYISGKTRQQCPPRPLCGAVVLLLGSRLYSTFFLHFCCTYKLRTLRKWRVATKSAVSFSWFFAHCSARGDRASRHSWLISELILETDIKEHDTNDHKSSQIVLTAGSHDKNK